jgi:hypothetical protein
VTFFTVSVATVSALVTLGEDSGFAWVGVLCSGMIEGLVADVSTEYCLSGVSEVNEGLIRTAGDSQAIPRPDDCRLRESVGLIA